LLCATSLIFFLGYKLRKHIAQALSRRCTAIRNTIDRYNDMAPKQTPPRPTLVYSEVVEYCNFSEFEILKHSDHSLLSKDWAKTENRQAAKKYFKMQRTEEEITRCNIEVTRLQAWVDKEDADLCRIVTAHEESNPTFATHLKAIQSQRCHVNEHLRTRLQQIYNLPGYCGPPPPMATSLLPVIASSSELRSAAMQFLTLLRSSFVVPTVSTTREEVRAHGDESGEDDQLPNDEDEDEMLQMTDTLAKIMV
jgi:hypothetical protein